MFSEWALGLWSGAGLAWWLIAWGLVRLERKNGVVDGNESAEREEFLSIFKPLSPLGAGELAALKAGLESFVRQLDPSSELLLGVHETDRAVVAAFIDRLQKDYPDAQLKVGYRDEPDELPNPKIAWQKFLAAHARGEFWLWSDADIVAPPGFLRSMRAEFRQSGASLLTFPYVVREVAGARSFLDALFVNAEFYPGVLFLRRLGPVDFGLGAGMLFRRRDFFEAVKWPELGFALADDFVLGQKLGPVRVSRTTLATAAGMATWREAVLHYLRWNKTIWWNRPVGSAARVLTLPVLGWLIFALFHPAEKWAWAGLVAMMQVDLLFAAAICRIVGGRVPLRYGLVLEAWSLGRALVWLACWFPWPVIWRGRKWWAATMKDTREVDERRKIL
jgi:hypothetical protein